MPIAAYLSIILMPAATMTAGLHVLVSSFCLLHHMLAHGFLPPLLEVLTLCLRCGGVWGSWEYEVLQADSITATGDAMAFNA